MASLNLSTNGPSITKSYHSVVNAPLPTGPSATSPTYGQWAIFAVQAPLMSAFQHDGGKESVLKVQSTGEGELVDFVEEFSDGRIQFGFVKIKDPNTTLPKTVLVGWCGEGVPERTKGYFTSHLAAVAKLLQGYHVQITARSENDIAPERIIQKVADASGSKYSGGGTVPPPSTKPLVGAKPVFMPTRIGSGQSSFDALSSTRTRILPTGPTDSDGWGTDAPPITRTQLEKVPAAYKPTKVMLSEFTAKSQQSTSSDNIKSINDDPDVVKGGYQPIGKVDIAELRRQARESGQLKDDRPVPAKSSYEPVGRVDIAAIRARAQPQAPEESASQASEEEKPQSLQQRSAAFQQSERLTSLPKPKIANKFGGSGSFTGTRAPLPGDLGSKANATSAPVGIASRTFADEGGKTPAQVWAEKKARQGGSTNTSAIPSSGNNKTLESQKSGDGAWKSSYTGKSWAPVQTTRTGQSVGSNTSEPQVDRQGDDAEPNPSESISSIRDRFSAAPPPMDISSKPNSGVRAVPSPPPAEDEEIVRPSSPIRVAMPISRSQEPDEQENDPPSPEKSAPVDHGHGAIKTEPQAPSSATPVNKGTLRALVQYDYEKAEDNEIELKEGEYVTNIDKVDEDWWMGQNTAGETGLFPANYVEIVDNEGALDQPAAKSDIPTPSAAANTITPTSIQASAAPATLPAKQQTATATAQYDYEAAEENELSFPDGATITNVEFPDDDWWFGQYNGKTGLFPANYVQLDS